MRPARPLLASLPLVLLLLAGCPGEEPGACSPELAKRAVVGLLYDWYLFPELLPSAVERVGAASRFATATELLDAMTAAARERGMDRGWSYLTTTRAAQAFFEDGKSVGLGVGLVVRAGAVRVAQVYGGSPAELAGFARGDTILRIGETEETLEPVTPENVGQLLGPATEGTTRAIEVQPSGDDPVVRTVTKAVFDLDPVPMTSDGRRWKIITRADGTKAGYVALRSFIATADAELESAFEGLRAEGVTEVVVDLRYNGGGLVRTGERLANLLAGGLAANDVMYRVTNSARQAAANGTAFFSPLASSVTTQRIAFVTTGASASASELVANVLEPHRAVAVVGSKTYGKPVGQRAFRVQGCETLVYLVSFRLENAESEGDFYDGLPDANGAFGGPLCAAADDLEQETWDEEEASTKAALHWLATGACPEAPAAAPGSSKPAVRLAPDAYPKATEPSLAQRHVQGLF
jgi:carboxyl-terminal processing protease